MIVTVLTAVGVFTVTNIDDLVVVTTLFNMARVGSGLNASHIVVGQYLGTAALVAVSAAAAGGLVTIDEHWVGLLGLIPIALGARGLWRARSNNGGAHQLPVTSPLGVASVTFANGADNISIYSPLFRQQGVAGTLTFITVFAVLVAVWCAAGAYLGRQKHVVTVLDKVGHWLAPAVFVVIGVLIIIDAGTIGHFLS